MNARPWLALGKPAFAGLCRPAHDRFVAGLKAPRETQENLLKDLLSRQEGTEWGKYLGIHRNLSAEQFRQRIPLTDFDSKSFSTWAEKQRREPNQAIMVPGGVRVFESTSGSSGRKKQIPYNRALLASFENYFKIWVYDWLRHGPKFKSLRTYLSVSPALRTLGEEDGLLDDTEYLSLPLRFLLRPFLSVPPTLKNAGDLDRFRDLTCAYLAADAQLELISVWHPSFLSLLWDHLLKHRPRIAAILRDGKSFGSGTERAIEALLSAQAFTPEQLWPELKMISAWDSANSRFAASQLRALFPHAQFQGKGLLATEAPLTLPLLGQDLGGIPLLTEVFFEFRDAEGRLFWIDEIETGKTYSLVISQKGGLLRYPMGDLVRVLKSRRENVPALEFLGREGEISDLVGEKISGTYLRTFEDSLVSHFGFLHHCLLPRFSESELSHYAILFDVANERLDLQSSVARAWEQNLQLSYHYRYARKLGQLGPVVAKRIPRLRERLIDFYQQRQGAKMGDIKLKTLITSPVEAGELWAKL